jgi:hypothetical protein
MATGEVAMIYTQAAVERAMKIAEVAAASLEESAAVDSGSGDVRRERADGAAVAPPLRPTWVRRAV